MAAAAFAALVWLSSPAVRAPWRVAVVAAIVCAMIVVAVAGGRVVSPTQRLAQVTSESAQGVNGSGQDRISVAQAAWPRIVSNPLVGTGLDTRDTGVTIISHGLSVQYQVHGLPLAASYETGVFGLAGLLALLIGLAVLGWRSVRRSRTGQELLVGWGLMAAFAAFLVEAMTQPMVFQQYGWIAPVMIVAWARRAEARELELSAPPAAGAGSVHPMDRRQIGPQPLRPQLSPTGHHFLTR
jgi:O-antigen ligase